MKILGYLLVLALFGGNKNKYNNFSIEVEKVHQLVKDIFKYDETTNEPHFMDDLRRGNLINKGTVAKYYSKAVRDYIIYRNVSSDEEGFVLTFNDVKPSAHSDNKTPDKEEKTPTVIFIPKKGVDVNDVNNKDLRAAIAEYIDTVQKKINSHEIGVAPTKSDLLKVDVHNNHFTINPSQQNNGEVPEEISKSTINKANKLKEDETKIDIRVEKNNQVSEDKNKTNVRDHNNISKAQLDKKPSLLKTILNKEKKISEDLNKSLHKDKIEIIPKVAEIRDKHIINEPNTELNIDNANITSRLFYENTPTVKQTNSTAAKDQNSQTHNTTSNFVSIGYDNIVDTKPKDLEVFNSKLKDKIFTAKKLYGIPDSLNTNDSFVKQKTKENQPKTNESNSNHSFNTVEEKEKIHKISNVIQKLDGDLKLLDTNNTREELLSAKTINEHKNKLKNKIIVEEKEGNDFQLETSKREESLSKFSTIDKSKPAISKCVPKLVSNNKNNVKDFENKTNTGNEIENNNGILGDDGRVSKLNKNLSEGLSFDTDKEETPESGNKNTFGSQNNQNLTEETNMFGSKDFKNVAKLKPIETETADSQETYEGKSEWSNDKNLNGEDNNNSEDDTEREPFLEILNLDEMKRAEEEGFSIELPEDDTSNRSSSEEDDYDVTDDYDE